MCNKSSEITAQSASEFWLPRSGSGGAAADPWPAHSRDPAHPGHSQRQPRCSSSIQGGYMWVRLTGWRIKLQIPKCKSSLLEPCLVHVGTQLWICEMGMAPEVAPGVAPGNSWAQGGTWTKPPSRVLWINGSSQNTHTCSRL